MKDSEHTVIDYVLHAVNFRSVSDAVTASVFHSTLAAVLHDNFDLISSDLVTFYEGVLRQPRVQWQFCDDTLDTTMPDGSLEYAFLVPENTELDSRSALAKNARQQLSYPPEWDDEQGPMELGSRLISPKRGGASSHAYVVRLICRRKGNPSLTALRESLQGLSGFPMRFILPIWGKESDTDLWAGCLREWTEEWLRSIQAPPVSVVVRFQDSEEERLRAVSLERALVRIGVPCCPIDEATHEDVVTYSEYLGDSRVREDGDHPSVSAESMIRWCRSGVEVLPDRWRALERAAIE